ncbi:MAG TPA: hypothetical protein VFX15_12175 [Actinomycetes bacterium]|nr:hypothetical protein [Actinomycetes bacterium]
MSRGDGVKRVFIHVGAPKTGTTYLQGILWRNRSELRRAGLHIVGQGPGDHYRAGHDIRGVEYNPNDPRPDWAGCWDLLAALAVKSEAPTTIISDEHLASLSPEQVKHAVESLAPREVHVVYATRNLARLLPSEYQEYVKHRSQLTYPDWVGRVFASRDKGPGHWFWLVHDPTEVVRRWTTGVAPERFHLMTLPPPGSPHDELWWRFAGVVGVDPEAAPDRVVQGNDSLGMAEAEVLRRVNIALPESFPRWHHSGIARDILATQILGPRSKSGRPRLPENLTDEVRAQTERNIAGLSAAGCDIVGDLTTLEITDDLAAGEPEPTSEEIIDAAVDGIAGLLVRMGRMRDDRRRSESRLRRQLSESTSLQRYRSRVASLADRTRLGSAALTRYRSYRERRRDS